MKIKGYNPDNIIEQIPSSVERWYDRQSRNWIVQLKDQNGNQIDNAIYVYSKQESITEEKKLKREYNI